MAFLVRSIHTGSAAFILGGAILLIIAFYLVRSEQVSSTAVMLKLMQAYEYGFWAAMGLMVATGVGNLGHFGEFLPDPETGWGARFLMKMYLLAFLLALSAVRFMALHLLTSAPPEQQRTRVGVMQSLYGMTAVLALAIGGFAVSLAHA